MWEVTHNLFPRCLLSNVPVLFACVVNGRLVAEAEYTHHGGFRLTKFASNEEKMTPAIGKPLAGIK